MSQKIPRRNRKELQFQSEALINQAIETVEEMGADTLLTDAVMLLVQAKNKISDYLDKQL